MGSRWTRPTRRWPRWTGSPRATTTRSSPISGCRAWTVSRFWPRSLRGGAYDFIQKPIDRDRFVASLHRAIEAHTLNRREKDRRSALGRCVSELELIVVRLGREGGASHD